MQTDKYAEPAELIYIIIVVAKSCATRKCTRRQRGLYCSDVCTQNAEVHALATRNYTISPMNAWTEDIARC